MAENTYAIVRRAQPQNTYNQFALPLDCQEQTQVNGARRVNGVKLVKSVEGSGSSGRRASVVLLLLLVNKKHVRLLAYDWLPT